jgi:hypothetical protein
MIARRCIQCHRLFDSYTVGDDLCSTECEDAHRKFIVDFQAMKKDAKWLTNAFEIPSSSSESLVRALCTADGKGSDFKRKVLAELIIRAKTEEYPQLK